MAGQRTLPGLGLSAFWTVGSNNWEIQHDPDTRKLSVLVQAAVISRTTSLPGSPADGVIYIVPSGDSNGNSIAARDNGAWVYYVPAVGFLVHVNDTGKFVKWTGAAWASVVPTEIAINDQVANYTLVLSDAGKYVRMNVAGANGLTVPANATVAYAIGAVIQVRQVGAGQTSIVPAVGVTVNTAETLKLRKQHSSASLIKVGTNEWDLTGDLEAV